MKAYTTLEEIELKRAAEERDKARFAEEQRLIQQRIGSEDIARRSAIPETGGTSVDEVASALPIYAGAADGGANLPANYGSTFKETFNKLTPQQQEMVLRGYGDAATPGGRVIADAAKGDTSAVAGQETPFVPENKERFEKLAALNLGTISVRQGAEGNYAVQPIADEAKIIANYKKLAMQSGNPVAIKAAQDSEISYLTREVGKQNIKLNDYGIKKAETAQKFKDDWAAEMQAAKKDHFKLMKKVETELNDPNVSLDSLVSKFGSQLKDVTGQSYSVKDGKIVTVGADGKPTIVASDINQAGQLLKEAATNHFGVDFQNRLLEKGLFETPADLAAFIKDKQDFFIKTGTLATARLSAEASQTTAAAATSNAKTNADKLKAEIDAGLFKAQAGNQNSSAGYHDTLKRLAVEKSDLDKEQRATVAKVVADWDKLSPADKEGQKGQDLIVKGAMAIAGKSGDLNGVLTAMKKPDKSGADAAWETVEKSMYANSAPPDQIAAARGNFYASRGFAPASAVSVVTSGKGPDGKPLTEVDVDNFNRQFPNSKVNKATLPWLKPAAAIPAATSTSTAAPAAPATAAIDKNFYGQDAITERKTRRIAQDAADEAKAKKQEEETRDNMKAIAASKANVFKGDRMVSPESSTVNSSTLLPNKTAIPAALTETKIKAEMEKLRAMPDGKNIPDDILRATAIRVLTK
jgi:hypothetical protein